MVDDAESEARSKGVTLAQLDPAPPASSYTQLATAAGAIIGTIIAALMGNWLGRRVTYFILCITSFAILQVFLLLITEFDSVFLVTAFLAGGITASFYGWLPLYLPELFRTGMRATGQGFGFNFGRIIAAVGALQTGALLKAFDNNYGEACSVAAGIYIAGLVLIAFAPETKGKPLPE